VNESEFNRKVDETLLAIEQALEYSGAELDWDLGGGILDIEFANGSHIIVNRQTPARQIWVATKGGGFHFDYDEATESWRLGNQELMQFLSAACTQQAGVAVVIR
jgi:CyaY protein